MRRKYTLPMVICPTIHNRETAIVWLFLFEVIVYLCCLSQAGHCANVTEWFGTGKLALCLNAKS